MRQSSIVSGFNYLSGEQIRRTWSGWQKEINTLETTGGYTKRIGGDLTGFDKKGHIVFEVYDGDPPVSDDVEALEQLGFLREVA